MDRNKQSQKGTWEPSLGPIGKSAHKGERRRSRDYESTSRSPPRRNQNYSAYSRAPSRNSWSSHERSRPSSYAEKEQDTDKLEGHQKYRQGGRERDVSTNRRKSKQDVRRYVERVTKSYHFVPDKLVHLRHHHESICSAQPKIRGRRRTKWT